MKWLVYILVGVLAACATPATQRVKVDDAAVAVETKKQSEIAIRSVVEDFVRLRNVAYPLATKANALCGENVSYTTGLLFANANMYKDLKEATGTVYGWTDVVKVMHVIPGSPGEASGIKVSDILVTINDWQVPVGDDAVKKFSKKLDEMTKEGKPVVLNVLRGEEKKQFTVYPEKACASEVWMAQDDIVNAFADGKHVVVTRGMLHFTKDDTELALVVSHEIAHNAMGHIGKQKKNAWWGIALDLLVAAGTGVNTQGAFQRAAMLKYSKDFEAEADYVGLYIMANAGMNIATAPEFWRRMAEAHPGSIRTNMLATHPATPYRLLALEEAVKEIDKKRESGASLVPELKDKKSQ